jgi:hypothetical protein
VHTHAKLLLAGAVATLALSVAVSTASANRLSMTSRAIRSVWRVVEFTASPGITVRCPLTVEGSFHSATFHKIRRALIGYMTRAGFGASASCTGGGMTVLTETLPWHVTYEKFEGTLPNITHVGVEVIGAGVRIEERSLGACLARAPAPGIEFLLVPFEPITIIWRPSSFTGGALCSLVREATMEGDNGRFTQLGNTIGVSIRLI